MSLFAAVGYAAVGTGAASGSGGGGGAATGDGDQISHTEKAHITLAIYDLGTLSACHANHNGADGNGNNKEHNHW